MIKLVVFDFDGVFSDGLFFFGTAQPVSKSYNARDSFALKMLRREGIMTGLISKDISNPFLKNAFHLTDRFDLISCGSSEAKLTVLKHWIAQHNIDMSEVAYIGDDISDIELLEHAGFSACPSDAVPAVRQTCAFVSAFPGGNGAVREFSEKIIEKNQQKDKITAIIPVRKGSKRCQEKNWREFGYGSSLLKKKILTLKKVRGIDRIIVTSDCPNMLRLAAELGVQTDKRPDLYAGDNKTCPASVFFRYLSKICPTGTLLHAPCTSPFVSVATYEHAIQMWTNKSPETDSVNSVSRCQEFLWKDKEAVNYDSECPPNSQDLPNMNKLSFGFNIIARSTCFNRSNVVGTRPSFIETSELESLDIDTQLQFDMCQHVERTFNAESANPLVLLDCTIRDGGYLSNWNFSDEFVKDAYVTCCALGYSFFEIGFRSNTELLPGKGKWCYSQDNIIESLSLPDGTCKLAVMAKVGTVTLDDFKPKEQSPITLVRVLIPRFYQNASVFHPVVVRDALELLNGLIQLGYQVCINIPCLDLLTIQDLDILSELFLPSVKCIYLADTFGTASEDQIREKIYIVRQRTTIPLGIHAHNNAESGIRKSAKAIEFGTTFVDTCIYGLGRGSGNLKTEVFYCEECDVDRDACVYLFKFIDTHVLSKSQYNAMRYGLNHPLYCLSKRLNIHPNYVDFVLKRSSNIEEDVKTLYVIHERTKNNTNKYFNKDIILQLADT